MRKMKKLVTSLLALCLMLNFCIFASAANLPPNTDENANAYSSDWAYWCQGASKYWGMRGYGCRMVAQSKLLVEAGIVQADDFDPDVYFEWCKSNGYIDGTTMCELKCGQGPGAYAKTLQKSLTYKEQISLRGSKAERAAQIMAYLNAGYYVILGSAAHHAYIGRSASLSAGTPVIYDSWSGYSYNTATVQNYTSYTLVNFSYMWIFSTGEVKEVTPPSPTVGATPVTGNADSVTETGAILRGSFTTTGKRATECGMYLGTDPNDLTKLGSDKVNTFGTSMFYSTEKYGRPLEPGTTYYYQAYAVVNRETYWGKTESFTTPKKDGPSAVTVTTRGADNITQTSAIVRGNISVTDGKATECGMYLGTSASNLSFLGSDSINSSDMPFYYSTSKYGRTLTAGTTYYYRAYAVVNGKTYWGEIESFMTPKKDDFPTVTVTTRGADNITQTSAIVRGNVSVTDGKATDCGMYLGTSASDLSFLGSDSINSSNMPFYYSTSKYGRTLEPGATYYYRAYAVVDGTTYWGEIKYFTTAASTQGTQGPITCVGTVVNTNGQYLAINDRAAASPKYSTQIGRIPPGGTVIVYPDKTSGNWYYVEYNGVSGYAYGKYLSLQ